MSSAGRTNRHRAHKGRQRPPVLETMPDDLFEIRLAALLEMRNSPHAWDRIEAEDQALALQFRATPEQRIRLIAGLKGVIA